MYQASILGKHVGHSDSIFIWNDVHSPLLPLVVQIELLDLLLQVVVVASLDDLINTGGHRHVALLHDLPIVVLPASSLKVVLTELQRVKIELNTGVVDHVLGDRHRGGSSERPERSVAWSVRLANLAVDAEAGELIALVQSINDGDDVEEDDGDGDEDAHLGNS